MPRTSTGESATSYLSFAISFRASRERISATRNRLNGKANCFEHAFEVKRLLLHSELTITGLEFCVSSRGLQERVIGSLLFFRSEGLAQFRLDL